MAWLWLHIPHFAATATRLQGAIAPGRPLLVVEGQIVRDCDRQAATRGVRPGLPLREARSRCPEAHVAAWDPAQARALWGRLAGRLRRLAPALESQPWEALALATLRSPHEGLLTAQQALAQARGLLVPLGAGWAGGRFAASLAARLAGTGQACLITPGCEAAFLAPLPLDCLPLTGEVLAELKLLGLSTVGDLARLPAAAIGTRLGSPGLRAWRLARGEEHARPPSPERTPERPARRAAFDPPLEWDASLAHALAQALAQLGADLEARGLACHELALELESEAGHAWRTACQPREPLGTPAGLAALSGALLAGVAAAGGERVAGLRVSARRSAPRTPTQPGLFPTASAAGAAWARAVRELAGRFPGCVWQGRRLDPDARLAQARATWQPWLDPEAR
jgi:protein ImuB